MDSNIFISLEELSKTVQQCRKCDLGSSRTQAVVGVGDPQAKLMFIGEAPGYHEDQKGEPFVGAAGKLLDQLLNEIGLNRSQVYIANVLKCRPPDNRDPKPEEIACCKPYLQEQIRLIDPVVVATLGRFAAGFVLDQAISMSQIRGQLINKDGRDILPLYHPAAALYTPSLQNTLRADFLKIKEMISISESPAKETAAQPLQLDPEQPLEESAQANEKKNSPNPQPRETEQLSLW